MWKRHLDRQYEDRRVYWDARASSRLGTDYENQRTICCIIDSIDRSKFALPRTGALQSKEMAGLERPRLDCTAVICHGHMLAIFIAEPGLVKGASWTVECLAHCFHVLQAERGIDLREYSVRLQGDNCSKELKSNSVAKFLSVMVARRRLRRADLQTLVSGHSHEDVDQYFSLMAGFLETQCELHNPAAFEAAIKTFVAAPSVRPHEPLRIVKRVSQVRDWPPGWFHYPFWPLYFGSKPMPMIEANS